VYGPLRVEDTPQAQLSEALEETRFDAWIVNGGVCDGRSHEESTGDSGVAAIIAVCPLRWRHFISGNVPALFSRGRRVGASCADVSPVFV